MSRSKQFLSLFISMILALIAMPGFCADKLKIGSVTYKSKAPIILQVAGDSSTVSFAANKGRRVGTANFIFQKVQIVKGAEFEVVSGANGADGKVLITATDQQVSGSGKVKLISTDAQSTATGTVTILDVDANGNFTFSVNATLSNLLSRITNPLSGNFNGTDSRAKGDLRISGTLNPSQP